MRSVCVLLACGVLAPPAWAFECTVGAKTCAVSPRWADRVATYRIETPPPDAPVTEGELREALERAAAHWTSLACTDLVIVEDPTSDNVVRVETKAWDSRAAEAALTHLSFDGNHGDIAKATIDLNAVHHHFAADECRAGATDLELVLIHELGHFIGLAHPCEYPRDNDVVMQALGDASLPPCETVSCDDLVGADGIPPATVMWPIVGACDPAARALAPDDVAGVCSIYPRRAAAQPCVALPLQEEPYVDNVPFGCATAPARGEAVALLLLAGVTVRRWPRRRRRQA